RGLRPEERHQAALDPAPREELLAETWGHTKDKHGQRKLRSAQAGKHRIQLRKRPGLAHMQELKDALQALGGAKKADDEQEQRYRRGVVRAQPEPLEERLVGQGSCAEGEKRENGLGGRGAQHEGSNG